MGRLEQGVWYDKGYDTKAHDGAFKRENTTIRNWITPEQAQSNRYHLYVSLACPWAHRALIFRRLKKLENHISLSIVSPYMLEDGWTFCQKEGSTGDKLHDFACLHEVYTAHDPHFTGRVTVPVLWDTYTHKMINNESSEIIRIFNGAFNHLTDNHDDYYPSALQERIDEINAFVYESINNGVYQCGFATSQKAYEQAYGKLFDALDKIEEKLSHNSFLVGSQITEADWRLFTTLIRFDVVYHGHFKCNKKRLKDYPALSHYLIKLYQWPDIAETVNFFHIKQHYYVSHPHINPTQIVPVGPDLDAFLLSSS
ncbi:MAG: glutathione-dependent reductase [Legionellaceae bacterium]|nr:glutathione-dependent reductase [Legionellaceae bacterium]HAF87619.1 glutathione-dependent reductase [Legionellales bacterium]HCA90264.1 glutathione-dependent reductase [Legionellales bacterium]|tara:strand:- start:4513 stop:5448 length:936 start_codon:yes stop_codon:yes gene_type:complete